MNQNKIESWAVGLQDTDSNWELESMAGAGNQFRKTKTNHQRKNMSGFSYKTKLAASIASGVPLEGNHADHIVPKSKGGSNDVTNCQIISPRANMMKSNNYQELREWQQDFLNDWMATHQTKDSYLLVAVPGSGKTTAALRAAGEFLRGNADRRLFVVVPTRNLQQQWTSCASRSGIELQSESFTGSMRRDFRGAVVTYQALGPLMTEALRYICSRDEVMVILDEPHHCGEDNTWGESAYNAFSLAKHKLLISGTPFRTDRKKIPFVSYNSDCVCEPDFSYFNQQAYSDGVVRGIVFRYSKGAYTVHDNGRTLRYEVNGEVEDREASKRLRHILNPSGDWVKVQLTDAVDALDEVREDIPDAGGMVVAMDMTHATQIAVALEEITGEAPAVLVSDEDIATSSVPAFKRSKRKWLVSVRQVSEGTDIPRLHVLCYMTNYCTEIFFRQLVGRVSRRRYRKGEHEAPSDDADSADRVAYVFLPGDSRLISFSDQIASEQLQSIKEDTECERAEKEYTQRTMEFMGPEFLGSDHLGTDVVLINGRQYSSEESYKIRMIADKAGCTEDKAADVFEMFRLSSGSSRVEHAEENVETHESAIKALRRVANKAACSCAFKLGLKPKQVNGKFPPHEAMTYEQLISKLATVNRWKKEGRIS